MFELRSVSGTTSLCDPEAAFEISRARRTRTIDIRGELDIATVGMLSQAVDAFLRTSPGDLTIDLRGLTFIDATGIGAMVRARNRQIAIGHELHFTGVTRRAAWVFGIVKLAHLLESRTDIGFA